VIYRAGKRVDAKTGLIGSFIFAVTPLSIQYGMVAVNDFVAVTFCIVGYYFLTSAIMRDMNQQNTPDIEKPILILAGVFTSLGVLVKTLFAPLFLAFVIILLLEGWITGIKTPNQVKNISYFTLSFLVFPLLMISFFYGIAGDDFLQQSFLQHIIKPPQSFVSRLKVAFKNLVTKNYFFIVFFLISAPFAIITSYGRGVLICILILLCSVIFLVPQQYSNYYHATIPFMAMVCGFFPLPDLERISIILRRVKFNKLFIWEISKVVLAIILLIPIVTSVSYSRLSERNDQTINWLEDNTSSDEYILTDNLNINFLAERRSPFAEISIDRTRLGQLNGEMFIEACYEFDVRVVVFTGRLFGRYKEYDVFLDFIFENYEVIHKGFFIYWRSSPL